MWMTICLPPPPAGSKVTFDYVIRRNRPAAINLAADIQSAQKKIGVSPEHFLHVGKAFTTTWFPHNHWGCPTVWVNRPSPRAGAGAAKPASGRPDLEVPNLETLAQLEIRTRTETGSNQRY